MSTCLAYGIGDHDCAEHPDATSVTPEPCATRSYRTRHLSVTLAPRHPDGPVVGRAGRPVCGWDNAYDQAALDSIAAGWGGKRPKRVADLPVCGRCAKKAEKAGVAL
jgi:hypothetical protein